MAVTTILTLVFIVASVNATFAWHDDDDFMRKHDFKFHHQRFPPFRPFHRLTFPTFHPFTMRPMVFVTPDITKNKDPNFSGVSVSSSSSSTVGKDGKVIQTGGATIVTNEGGVIKKYEIGEDPPKVTPPPVIVPQMPIIQPIFPLLPILPGFPLSPEELKHYKPGENEHFIGTSSITYSHLANINGETRTVGGSEIISNMDGEVFEKSDIYGDKDPIVSGENNAYINHENVATVTIKAADNEV